MGLRLLFVCTGNTCRSPLAEALARQIFGENVEIRSAGIAAWEGSKASPEAIAAGKEFGLDLTSHQAALLSKEPLEQYDWIIPMTKDQERILHQQYPALKERIKRLGAWGETGEDVADPWGGSLETYRETALQIQKMLMELKQKIKIDED